MSRQVPDGVLLFPVHRFWAEAVPLAGSLAKGRCLIAVPKIESRTSTVKRIGSIIEIMGGESGQKHYS